MAVQWAVRFVAVVTLVLSMGLHWAVLQTAAWTGMMLRYSQGVSFKEAMTKTFDGQHPCALCKAIQKGRAEEQKREQQQINPTLKLDVAVVWQAAEFESVIKDAPIPVPDLRALTRSETPPKPRPRLSLQVVPV